MKSHTFAEVQIEDEFGQQTCIPHLKSQTSVFFQSYSNDQFQEIFEDLNSHYKRLCEDEPGVDDEDDSQDVGQF